MQLLNNTSPEGRWVIDMWPKIFLFILLCCSSGGVGRVILNVMVAVVDFDISVLPYGNLQKKSHWNCEMALWVMQETTNFEDVILKSQIIIK